MSKFLQIYISETEDQLPTSVLLQRIRVGGEKEKEKEKTGRRKGRLVRRRRRRRKNSQQGDTQGAERDLVRGRAVYFTPL